jgi:hypothetical protein
MASPDVVLEEALDLLDEIPDAAERTSADRSLRDDVQPDLDLVEPGGVGRGVEARTRSEPSPDRGALVSGVVVDDDMDIELLRDRLLDVA